MFLYDLVGRSEFGTFIQYVAAFLAENFLGHKGFPTDSRELKGQAIYTLPCVFGVFVCNTWSRLFLLWCIVLCKC